MASSQVFPSFAASVRPSELLPLKPFVYKKITVTQPFDVDKKLDWYGPGCVIELAAPSGAGKSTILPLMLASNVKGACILAAVSEHAAAATHRRIADSNRSATSVNLALDPSAQFPVSGIVVTTAAVVVARIAEGKFKREACISVLIIDDAFSPLPVTSALRRIAPSLSFMSVLAMDSCTSGSTFLPAYNVGKFSDAKYVPESFDDPWSVTDRRSPWSISAMEKHSLIYVESEARAADLMQAYAMNGVPCLRWRKETTVRNFLADLDYLEASSDKNIAVLAHTSFRYGIMAPFGTVIDTALKDVLSVGAHGEVIAARESISSYEMQKGKHRGGHFSGIYTVHWSPRDATSAPGRAGMSVTDQQFEVLTAAACGYKLLHATSLPILDGTKDVDDVARLLNSELPLGAASLRGDVGKKPFDDTYQTFGCAVPRVVSSDPDGDFMTSISEVDDLLNDLNVKSAVPEPDYVGAHFGKYATVDEGLTVSSRSPMFPNGAKSLAKMLSKADDLDVLLGAWDEFDRNVASNIACNSYNAELVSLKALTTLIRHVKTEGSVDSFDLHTWSRDVADELASHVMEARRWYATLMYTSHDLFPIVYDKLDFSAEETDIVDRRRAELLDAKGKRNVRSSPSIDRDREFLKPARVSLDSKSKSSVSSSRSGSSGSKTVRFKSRQRISELPGYSFNDLVVSWVGGRTKQYRRSLERKVIEAE